MVGSVTDLRIGLAVCDAGGKRIGTVKDIWYPSDPAPPPPMPGEEQPGEGYIRVDRGVSETELYVPFHEILQIAPEGVRLAFGEDRADEYVGKPRFLD